MEEKVVLNVSSGVEDRGDLNIAAFIDSRYEIERCEAETKDSSVYGDCGELETAGWLGWV